MMKKILYSAAVLLLPTLGVQAQDAAAGEKKFNTVCTACHTVGGGKRVGPDLKGVTNKRTEKWLMSFIKSSQTMVKSGDKDAVAIFKEFNNIPMPDQNLSDKELKDLIAFFKSKSPAAKTTPAKTTPAKTTTTTPAKTGGKPEAKATEKEPEWTPADIQIKSVKSTTPLDAKNLKADVWQKAVATKVTIGAQNLVYPTLLNPSVSEISVKSAYADKQVAFMIEWKDENKSIDVDVDKFCDQLAVQFPVSLQNGVPSYMMGNQGGRVHITHWKAIWQEDCENGFRDIQERYPNMWVDIYPGQEGHLDRSKRVYAKDITAEQVVESRQFNAMPGTYSQNMMSKIKRSTPVEEASAEGFGTLATQETQAASGWAEWKDGKWCVVVVIPVNTGNIHKAAFKNKTKVAFAIWDGGKENIGGRKHFTQWNDLILE